MHKPALLFVGAVTLLVAVAVAMPHAPTLDTVGILGALWGGSFGSWYSFTSATLVRSIPLMLTGGAVAIAFRAGVFNIGAEGQLLAGASAATAVALAFPHGGALTVVLALLCGAAAGSAWAGIAALLRARFGVLEVISTIMLNFVALHAVAYVVRGPLQEPTHSYPQTSTIADAVHLPQLPGAGRLHAGIALAVLALAFGGWALRWTASGFRMLVVGESRSAAASAGMIDVERTIWGAFLCSGGLAGLAGAVEVLGVTFALYENISPGYGYTAIAVALLASLDPWRVILSAILFGALDAGAAAMQRDAGVPAAVVSVIQALLILGVIGLRAVRWRDRWRTPSPEDAEAVRT